MKKLRMVVSIVFVFTVMWVQLYMSNGDAPIIQRAEASYFDKELVVAVRQAPSTFDPWAPPNAYDTIGRNQVYDTLVSKDGKGQITPSLAERYEVSSDGMVYTFHLRKGVKFTDGTELRASDVKFSIDRAMQAPATKGYFSCIENIDVVDEYTVKFNMKAPNVTLYEILFTWGQIVNEKVAREYGDRFGIALDSIVGTGPYSVKEWKSGESCLFEANLDYFKGEPNIKKVLFKSITDPNAVIIALTTGEVDLYLDSIPPIAVEPIQNNKNLRIVSVTPKKLFYLFMNNEHGPFTDIRLRRAIAYSIDREKLVEIGTEGYGYPVFYPGACGYVGDPGLDVKYPIDIEKAKQLVKETGMQGKTITLSLENTSPLPLLATALQHDLSKIGLNVAIQPLEVNTYLQDVYTQGKFEIAVSYSTAKTKDMDTVWTMMCTCPFIGSGNSARYCNPTLDKILEMARMEQNIDMRKQHYAKAIKIFIEDVPWLPLYYEYSTRVHSKQLHIDEGFAEYDNLYYYKWQQ